jgi:hypothetical protein
VQQRDNAGVGDACPDLEAELLQVRRDDSRRAEFTIAEFRVAVEIPAPLDHVRLERGDRIVKLVARYLGASGSHRYKPHRN